MKLISRADPVPQACLAGTKRRNHRDARSSKITRGNFGEGLGWPFGVLKDFRRSHCYRLTSEGLGCEHRGVVGTTSARCEAAAATQSPR